MPAFLPLRRSRLPSECWAAFQANAQTAEQAAEVVKSLSTQSHAVVARLSDLNHLSADEWRFHPGDLPHGESPDLDDSN